MRKFFTLFILVTLIVLDIKSQTCNGAAPTVVTQSIANWSAVDGIGVSGNSNATLCGFPANANITGVAWNITSANATGDSWCSELIFDLDNEVDLTPYTANSGGSCGTASGGDAFILQDNSLEITANASGCITISVYLDYTTPPVGINGINGSLTFTACPQNVPLPIELKTRRAFNKGNQNLITWTNASESNNDVQMVERSIDGKSGWEMIDKVAGTNKSEEVTYEVVDENPMNTSFYRIHAIDFDGREQFSKIVVVRREGRSGIINSIQPNPTINFIEVELQPENSGDIKYSVMDVTGKLVKSIALYAKDGELNTHKIDMSDLQNGLYIISIRGGGLLQNTKIIKE